MKLEEKPSMFIGLVWWFTNFSNMIKKFHVCLDSLETCVVFFFRFKKKKKWKNIPHMYDEHAWIFFSPIKKKQRDFDYQACSSHMVGYFFQGVNFFFFEKNTHACSSDMRVILPYTVFFFCARNEKQLFHSFNRFFSKNM